MKVLFKSFFLFILGILADTNKNALERAVNRCMASGSDISSKRLTKMSDRSYSLYSKFLSLERDIKLELAYKML